MHSGDITHRSACHGRTRRPRRPDLAGTSRAATLAITLLMGALLSVGPDAGASAADPPPVRSTAPSMCTEGLAIGVPYEQLSGFPEAGAAHYLHRGSAGLTTAGAQWLDQNTLGLGMQERDRFGCSLASADMDGDGYDDLAIGVPGVNLGGIDDAGQVDVLFGGPSGLSTAGAVYFDQDILGLTPEEGDSFGRSLAAGDLNRDGCADLAIGVPVEGVSGAPETGGVHVLYGDSTGNFLKLRQWFDQNLPDLGDAAEPGDGFGFSLAVVESTLLFRDGLESGTTALWSATWP